MATERTIDTRSIMSAADRLVMTTALRSGASVDTGPEQTTAQDDKQASR
jgi:hypothetical protein